MPNYNSRIFRIFLLTFLFFSGFGRSFAITQDLDYRNHEINAYVEAGYVQASLLQQSYVQLVAPDVQNQLQQLADEIAVANGVDNVLFRVHITNDNYLGTYSMGSGDIFIPVAYLDMVSNRDEIAFGLAREIATQHRLLHLRDLEESYQEDIRNQELAFYSGLVVSSAIHSAFNHIVVRPIHKQIMKSLIDSSGPSPYMSVELQRMVVFQKTMQYRQMSENVGSILGVLLGWAPQTISNESLKLVGQMIQVSNEDADESRRQDKNQFGLTYMAVAGFDPSAGESVINKLEEWWDNVESTK